MYFLWLTCRKNSEHRQYSVCSSWGECFFVLFLFFKSLSKTAKTKTNKPNLKGNWENKECFYSQKVEPHIYIYIYLISLCTPVTIHLPDKVAWDFLLLSSALICCSRSFCLLPACHVTGCVACLCFNVFFGANEPDDSPDRYDPSIQTCCRVLAGSPLKLLHVSCYASGCLCVVCLCLIIVFSPSIECIIQNKGSISENIVGNTISKTVLKFMKQWRNIQECVMFSKLFK